jgi:hypothetical protein
MKIEVPKGATSVEIAFNEAAKQGCVEVPLVDPPEGIRKATGIDILRMRGTPIELIGSCIAADDMKTAGAAFRTSILEYVYEKIEAYCGANVFFMNSRDLHRKEEQLGLIVESDGPFSVIGLTPAHDTVPCTGTGIAKVCKVESGELEETIDDHITASVMAIIEKLTGNIIAEITPPLNKVMEQRGDGIIEVRLVVDLFEYELRANAKRVTAHVNVPMVAFWAGRA